uniref:ARF GTPase-activating protein GIT1 C-terminal domain-containing protein n=1 Tax=Ciona savignyi TaxID=51511 RepID=H2ZEB6_CIOSA
DNSGPPGGGAEQTGSKRTSSNSPDSAKKSSPTDSNANNNNENNNHSTEKSESPPALQEPTQHKPGSLPKADEVIRKTDTVTKNISNLLQAAQKGKSESYPECAENIYTAVQEIVALFPDDQNDPDMKIVLDKLNSGADKLRNRCREVAEQGIANSKQVTEDIIKNAYGIAKAEKELVTMTTKLLSVDTLQDTNS